jgi:hypothetical protein
MIHCSTTHRHDQSNFQNREQPKTSRAKLKKKIPERVCRIWQFPLQALESNRSDQLGKLW